MEENNNTNLIFKENFSLRLKNETDAYHKLLESLPISQLIMSPELSIDQYSHYLNLMADVHFDMELSVFPILQNIIPEIDQRRKWHLIQDDLLHIGKYKNNKFKVFLTPRITVPFALGIMYVVEGSSLGGKFILKNIISTLKLTEIDGAKYFNGYGNQTGMMWKNFLNTLSLNEQETNAGDEIIAGACFAFSSIYNHFLNTLNSEN